MEVGKGLLIGELSRKETNIKRKPCLHRAELNILYMYIHVYVSTWYGTFAHTYVHT